MFTVNWPESPNLNGSRNMRVTMCGNSLINWVFCVCVWGGELYVNFMSNISSGGTMVIPSRCEIQTLLIS